MDDTPTFSPRQWAERFAANAEEADRNAMMDSGWSKTTADHCDAVAADLMRELIYELRQVEVLPSDFFDRPRLAAVLSAVHEAWKEATGG